MSRSTKTNSYGQEQIVAYSGVSSMLRETGQMLRDSLKSQESTEELETLSIRPEYLEIPLISTKKEHISTKQSLRLNKKAQEKWYK